MIASARSGNITGPGRLRTTAIAIAKARMHTSATQKILTFSQKASRIGRKLVRK